MPIRASTIPVAFVAAIVNVTIHEGGRNLNLFPPSSIISGLGGGAEHTVVAVWNSFLPMVEEPTGSGGGFVLGPAGPGHAPPDRTHHPP